MSYRIHGWLEERGTGTIDESAETKEEAFRKARNLRRQGIKVRVTTAEGKPVSEEDDE